MAVAEKAEPRVGRRPEFHRLTVKEVRKETPEATSVAFNVPANLPMPTASSRAST